MDRESAVKMWRDAGGSSAGLSGHLPMAMVIEQFAHRVEAAERERCAAILKARADKIAAEAERAVKSEPDEVSALRAMAWQLTVAEREIRGA